MKEVSVYYRLKNLEIVGMCDGRQTLRGFKGLDLEDAELIYGIVYIQTNDFISKHPNMFKLVKCGEEFKIQLKDDIKESLDILN